MVFSYYLYKYPYKLLWLINKYIARTHKLAFYCADPLDYEMFQSIQKFLPPMQIIAKNGKVKKYLKERGIEYTGMPAFPEVVIMGRQTPYKFPVDNIIRIGFDHGLYQFKRWTDPRNYNDFTVYFVSSSEQVRIAKTHGINTVEAIGYPKLDNAFNGVYNDGYLAELKTKIGIDPERKTIIFTSTWDVAGLSALPKWIDGLETLSRKYNILVTVHTWTSQKYIEQLKSMKNIFYIDEYDVTPYMMISDVLIGDYSSIIGEFCAFDKPIITFKVRESGRTIPEILNMLESISLQINEFQELPEAIVKSLADPKAKSAERQAANKILFYTLDGKAGKRAADRILRLIRP